MVLRQQPGFKAVSAIQIAFLRQQEKFRTASRPLRSPSHYSPSMVVVVPWLDCLARMHRDHPRSWRRCFDC